jgi:hypothetical protein
MFVLEVTQSRLYRLCPYWVKIFLFILLKSVKLTPVNILEIKFAQSIFLSKHVNFLSSKAINPVVQW